MSKTASEIVDRALTLIDEISTTFETAATTETSIKSQALEILPNVCRDLIKELPYELKRYLATSAVLVPDDLIDGEDQSSYVKQKLAFEFPSDFWELVSIRLKVWARPVTSYVLIGSPEYSILNNPFTRPGKQNPAVALSNTTDDSDSRMECFSIINGDDQDVVSFYYVSFDNVPDDDGNVWPDELFDEITKALATELNIIKSRFNEAEIRSSEVSTTLDQHQ